MLPIINCPKCGNPIERAYLRAEWAIVDDARLAVVLREMDQKEREGKMGGNWYGGRVFDLLHPSHPREGQKRLHCLRCFDCLVVIACSRDDASADFPDMKPD